MPNATEVLVRQFAEQHPTPHVVEALRYCETGRLTWEAVARLFEHSLGKALLEVNDAEDTALVELVEGMIARSENVGPELRRLYEAAVNRLDKEV